MRLWYAGWASAIAIVAGVALGGCAEENSGLGNPISATAGASGTPLGGVGGLGGSGGMIATPTSGGAGSVSAGAGGATPSGGTGGVAAGAGGQPVGGAGGAGSGGAGSGGAAGEPMAGAGGAPGMVTNCGSADNADQTMGPGPFTPTIMMNGGPTGSSWVFYPMEIGRDGCKHPIFNWGPGAGTGPSNYRDHLNHIASHGFVVISQPSSGDGSAEKASLEWLMEQNDAAGSPFNQKLDLTKVVMGGHSLGALTTFAMADYEPLTHYILVCGGSFGAPTGAQNIHGPTVILGGDTDTGTPNFEDDYEAIPTPVVFLIKSGTDHIACARNNLEPWTAFMRWQLFGEEKWKKEFFTGGKFCNAPWDSCESKGW